MLTGTQSINLFAQQVDIDTSAFQDYTPYKNTWSFNSQFESHLNSIFSLENTSYYQSASVRKVKIYNNDDELEWMIELDKNGMIIKRGIQDYNYYVTEENIYAKSGQKLTVTKYYKAEKLSRIDTSHITSYSYINGDTTLTYSKSTELVYMIGDLINKRNDYYNTKYFESNIGQDNENDRKPFFKLMSNKSTLKSMPFVNYKTNYNSDVFHFCRRETYHTDLVAKINDTIVSFDDDLLTHPFFLISTTDFEDCFVDGACFDEPAVMIEDFNCNFPIQSEKDGCKNVRYNYLSDESGLHIEFHALYFDEPSDTSAENLTTVKIDLNNQIPTNVLVLYTFRYEFFE